MIKTLAELKALWVTGYEPTQQDFADLFDSLESPIKKKVIHFTQDQTRAMSSANEGMGQYLKESEAEKCFQLLSCAVQFHTEGVQPLSEAPLTSIQTYAPSGYNSGLTTNVDSDIVNGKILFLTRDTTLTPQELYSAPGEPLYIWANVPNDFEGTSSVIITYLELDFSAED